MLAPLDADGRSCVPIFAFTATWGRADGLGLGKVIDKIVWHGDWLEMIRGGWSVATVVASSRYHLTPAVLSSRLSPVRFTTVSLGSALDLDTVSVSASSGEFSLPSLARAVDKSSVNELVVQAWLDNAQPAGCKSTLVFAVNVSHVESLSQKFIDHGIEARFVHEKVKPAERDRIYDDFKKGRFPVLVNCTILTEGAE